MPPYGSAARASLCLSSEWELSFSLEPRGVVHRLSVLNGYALNYLGRANHKGGSFWEYLMETYVSRNKRYIKNKQIGDGMPFSEDILEMCRLKMSVQLKHEKRLHTTALNDDVEAYILEFIGERNDAISFCIAFRVHTHINKCLMMDPSDYEVICR